MKKLTDKIIESLNSKHDAFIGSQKDEISQAEGRGFKNGLSWAIDTVQTLSDQHEAELTADQPQPTKAEEIKQKIKQIIVGNIGITETESSQRITGLDDAVSIIADFLEEYRREGVPTDEEIVTWAKTVDVENEDDMSPFKYMVFAAKWCRDKLNLK